MSYDVFISYARADNKTGIITQFVEAFARKYNALTGQNLQCFFDVEEIKTAQDWELRLLESLSQSRSMIAFLSSDYIKSEYCRLEWSRFDFHSALNLVVDQGIRPLVIMKIEEFESELKKASPEVQRLFNPIQRQAIPLNEFIDSLTDDYIKQRIPTLTSSDNPVLSELDESIRWVQRLSQRREQAENSQRHGSFMAMNRRFVGRTTELRELRKALAECREVAVSAEGIAGIGKSELATAYAHAFAWDYPAGRWFIPCEDQTNLTELLARYMSEGLGIDLTPEDRKRPDSGFYRIRYHLNSLPLEKRKVLVVLDNVNKDQLVSNVAMRELGVNADDFDILITSRKRLRSGGKDEYLRTVTLGRLGDDELLNLLGVGISAPTPEREAGLLFIEKTGGLTLAIEIAGVYCRNHSVKISDYVGNLQSALEHLTETSKELDEEGRINDIAHREPFIQQIFRTSIETLSPIQQAILCYAACCHPDFVPRSWLQELVSNEFPELEIVKLGMLGQSQFDKDLQVLLDASLLESPLEGTDNYRIHRLIAETIRQMPLWNTERAEHFINLIEEILALEWYDQNPLLQPRAIVAWLETQRADSLRFLTIRGKCANLCKNKGIENEAEKLYRQVLDISVRKLGLEHRYTLVTLNNLAELLRRKGELVEAEKLHRQDLESRKRLFGPNHPDTLSSLNNLAILLKDKGKLREAENLFRQVLKAREQHFGLEHTNTLSALHNLAILLKDKGELEEAERLSRQVHKSIEQIKGSEHPNTLISLGNLAILLHRKGEREEAEKLCRQILEARERILGPEHTDTLTTISNLANMLQNKGDHVEAEKLYRQALSTRERLFGPNHFDTLSSLNNLASLLHHKGELGEAERLSRQVQDISGGKLGTEHPFTLGSVSDLANLLHDKGALKEAEKLHRQVLESRKRLFGPNHPDTLSSLNNLANLLHDKGEIEEAEKLYRQALSTRERLFGPNHFDTLSSLNNLANLLHDKGEIEDAEKLYRMVIEVNEQLMGRENIDTLGFLCNLANLLYKKGDLEEAEQIYQQVFEARERIKGPEHPDTLSSLHNLANCLYKKGDLEEAEKLYRQVFETRQRILGQEHKDTKSTAQAVQRVQESITQVENCKGKMDCPRCQGTGFVTMQDIVRLEMMGELQLGVCPLCSASL
jgi:tetratricopeptide (TPR) repeat protein